MTKTGWWSGDDHVHFYRDERKFDKIVFNSAMAEDIHVVNCLRMGSAIGTSGNPFGYGEEACVRFKDCILVTGQEEPRTQLLGHVIGLNITGYVSDKEHYMLYDRIFKQLRMQGALVGFAHMNWNKKHKGDDIEGADYTKLLSGGSRAIVGLTLALPDGWIDFLEIINTGRPIETTYYYDLLNMGFRLPAMAGSDYPGRHIGDVRSYINIGKGVALSRQVWMDSLKKGYTFISSGPLVEFSINGKIPGDTIKCKAGDTLNIQIQAFGHPDIGSPKEISLVSMGEEIGKWESSNAKTTELSKKIELKADKSQWLVVRVKAHNKSEAHTSPIYVVVDDKPVLGSREQIKKFADKMRVRVLNLKLLMKKLEQPLENEKSLIKVRRTELKVLRRDKDIINEQLNKALKFWEGYLNEK